MVPQNDRVNRYNSSHAQSVRVTATAVTGLPSDSDNGRWLLTHSSIGFVMMAFVCGNSQSVMKRTTTPFNLLYKKYQDDKVLCRCGRSFMKPLYLIMNTKAR